VLNCCVPDKKYERKVKALSPVQSPKIIALYGIGAAQNLTCTSNISAIYDADCDSWIMFLDRPDSAENLADASV